MEKGIAPFVVICNQCSRHIEIPKCVSVLKNGNTPVLLVTCPACENSKEFISQK